MSTPRPLMLVIGCGSIGERHIRSFLTTKRVDVLACDNRPAVCKEISARYAVETGTDWATMLANPALTGAIIATPARSHAEIAIHCLEKGQHVLIEKPLALDFTQIEALQAARKRAERFAGVAYVLHFVPALAAAREFLRAGSVGTIHHVAVNSGQHFPSFRPSYRDIYYRDRAQGGGAIQDALTHLANAVEWVVGPTERVSCAAAHQALAGVTVEDTVNVIAHNGPTLVSYALNQFQAPNETRLDFHAESGTVRIEFHTQRWGVYAQGDLDWTWHSTPIVDRDQIYAAQANAFLDGCAGLPNQLCTLEEGIQTLRFNLAALEAWSAGRETTL